MKLSLPSLVRRSGATIAAVAVLSGLSAIAGVALAESGHVPAALAQSQSESPNAREGNRGGGRMRRMLEGLNLTGQQRERIASIVQNARQENQNVTDRSQRRANMQKTVAQIREVLSPAQRRQFDEKVQAMRRHRQQQDRTTPNARGG